MQRKTHLSLYIEATKLGGGFTVDGRLRPIETSGETYAYSVYGFETRIATSVVDLATFRSVLKRYATLVSKAGFPWFIGVWNDGAELVFDVSIVTTDSLRDVIRSARANKQKAIWDFRNAREIRVGRFDDTGAYCIPASAYP